MSEPNIKLNPTLDKNGNPTAQARMTSTEDQQKCQMEIARYMPRSCFSPALWDPICNIETVG